MAKGEQDRDGMYGGRADPSGTTAPPWLVRAEVTIRHGIPVTSAESDDTSRVGTTSTIADPNGVRMVYRWSPNQANSSINDQQQQQSTGSEVPVGAFGFQRGNILFTSTPPSRSVPVRSYTIPRTGTGPISSNDGFPGRRFVGTSVTDSGYNSEQFSPQSYSSLPSSRRSLQQYNRRCRSTCSIVLSTVGSDNNPKTATCARSQSLHSSSSESQSLQDGLSSKVRCGDPRCYHTTHQHVSARCQFSTVPEGCEDCAEGLAANSSGAFATHFCTRVLPDKSVAKKTTIDSRDAASQTTDVDPQESQPIGPGSSRMYSTRRKTAPGFLRTDERRKKTQVNQPLSPPAGTRSSASPAEQDKSDSSEREDESAKRKSRTVHIDVYCTGSDDDVDDSNDAGSSSSENKVDTPTTVFENDDVKITHCRAKDDDALPRGFQDDKAFLKRASERNSDSFRNAPMRMPSLASTKGYESDDVLSSLYPSQFSSYSALRDLDSAAWSVASSSAAIPHDGYDSTSATSWKDTFSDIESLINSRTSLTPCDSFEYANTSDRERIEKMEAAWAQSEKEERTKTWRSPQIERRHLLQNRKMKEYLEKHQIGWSSGESGAETDDSDGVAWSFVSSDEHSRVVKRESTVRRMDKETMEPDEAVPSSSINPASARKLLRKDQLERACYSDSASHSRALRDQIGPFGSESSSPLPSKVESRVTSPFTTPQGEKTDHILKASVFGTVVGAFRKPGHHVGPSKNPSCSCEHCRRFFEEDGPRGRSRSLGDLERRPGLWFQKRNDIVSPAPTGSNN